MVTTRILIDNSLDAGASSYLFDAPCGEIRADAPEAVEGAIAALEAATDNGLWAAGFFAYELGYLLEPKLQPLLPATREVPLLRFALFPERTELTTAETDALLERWREGEHEVTRPLLTVGRETYRQQFSRARDYIGAGDIYQLNLTLKGHFTLKGCPVALYRALRAKQPVAHGALMQFDGLSILSHSPELFLSVESGNALTRPMKGTAARGMTLDGDHAARKWLESDEKSRAENLMIVDLMRNDLARVALPGSVAVGDLFTVETYSTLHQMTSGVCARLRDGTGLRELLRALFPAGSITGAPKVRAMEIIRELEGAPRGVYTGAVGMLVPGGDARFNVAIRTVVVDGAGNGEIGIGSGLVADSAADAEYDECVLKMRFLTEPAREFDLIETLLFDAGDGYALLDRHLDRLGSSAAYFGYPFARDAICAALDRETAGRLEERLRVRLLLGRDGTITVSSMPMGAPTAGQAMHYVLSDQTTDSGDVFLYHKTTVRDLYDGEHARAADSQGADEVLFVNERGELTEGSRTNIFVERGGILLTPPVSAGLLAGTLRAELFAAGRAREAVLTPADLDADAPVYLGNSVRGLLPAFPVLSAGAAAWRAAGS